MKRQALFLLLILAGMISIAATSAFYITDDDGDRLPFGTSGSLHFPNITGAPNNITVIFDHTDLANKGTQPHSAIDSHLTDSSVHFTESSIAHQNIFGAGTNTHTQIDTQLSDLANHVSDEDIHFTQAQIDHSALIGASGYKTHSTIDAHIDNAGIHGGGTGTALTVTDDTTSVSNVDTLRFNPSAGFSVFDNLSGDVTIDLGSSWNPIQVSGQTDLDASGEEALQIVAGTGISLATNTTTTPKRLTITATGGGSGGLVVDTDTTCYVATTGSDTTGDGTSGTPYATPQKCLTAYAGYKINSDVWLTIQLADGTYTLTTPIEITHANGDRIRISGAHAYETTMSSLSVTGSDSNYAITLNVADASNAAVNDFVIVRSPTGGSNPSYAAGIWKVTATGSGTITVSSSHTWFPYGAVTGTVEILKTMIFNNTSHAVVVQNAAVLGDLTKIAIISDRSNASIQGLHVAFNATLSTTKPFGLSGWSTVAESSRGSAMNLQYAVVSNCDYCVLATMGMINISYGQIVSGNYGLWSGRFGGIEAVAAIVSSKTRNFSAYSFSFIESNQAVSTGGADSSPAIDTVGNKNSLVSRD